MGAELPPRAQVVRFFPRRGTHYRREVDHLALAEVEQTLCGIKLGWPKSSGTHMTDDFDPSASYSCQRCVAALRKRGPVRVSVALSYSTEPRERIVQAAA